MVMLSNAEEKPENSTLPFTTISRRPTWSAAWRRTMVSAPGPVSSAVTSKVRPSTGEDSSCTVGRVRFSRASRVGRTGRWIFCLGLVRQREKNTEYLRDGSLRVGNPGEGGWAEKG